MLRNGRAAWAHISGDAENPLKFEGSGKDVCLHRWFPNPMARFLIGRDWRKMIWVLMGLCLESWKSFFQKFYLKCTPSGMVISIALAARSDALESRSATNRVIVMGVYQRLLDDVGRLVKKEKLFDVVVEATLLLHRFAVLKGIHGEFAYALSLKLINDEAVPRIVDLLWKKLEDDLMRKILIMHHQLVKKEKEKLFDVEEKQFDVQCGCRGNFITSQTCGMRGEFFHALDLKY
ncbi:hypothetical protein BT93_A0987 [Corymbia citriodora subsp. variegata]|nr:hypothetical protein BT93_A0987 [Corymbia citriodora subsp. variegata]